MNKLAVDIGKSFLGNSSANLKDASGINVYVSAIITGAISVAGIILLFILIGGGIGIIKGAGKSDPKTVEQGKQAATSALIGFIVVFSAYWIVKLIETITGLSLISL
jgi:hypothetical protein